MPSSRNRGRLVQQPGQGMQLLNGEAASEIGISNHNQGFRGDLPSRGNGLVGG